MTRFSFLLLSALLSVFLVLQGGHAHAASSFLPSTKAEEAPATDPKQVNQLIDTLENDQSRKAFIDNLKLLLQEQEKQEEAATAPLTETIGVRGVISHGVTAYQKFLTDHNLSSSLVHQSIGSLVVLLLALIAYFAIRKSAQKSINKINKLLDSSGLQLARRGLYSAILHIILKILLSGITIYTLGKIWSVSTVDHFFESAQMRAFLSTSFTVLLVAALFAVIWESIGLYLSYAFKQADDMNQTRVKTILPIIRNVLMMVFAVLFGLVLLSELGINVTPLLAGAGVVGVALGFGAQSMVKDFLCGFTIILEDLVRVGDVATLGGHTGVIEKITLRKIQMRDVAGAVYTVPFSEITIIQNLTKDFSYYVMEIGVSYATDTDKAITVLKDIDTDLRADPEFSPLVLDPIEVLGVDRFSENSVIIKARIKTIPTKQWLIGREFNRRMKIAFEKEKIEIPFPQRTITIVNAAPATE